MRRLWPLTARGTGALILAVACFIIANEVGIVELMYFGILLLAVLAASVASLYLTRRSDTVTRSLSPDVATVGRDALVTVRVGVRTALPTAPGTWRDTVPKGLAAQGAGGLPRARLGTARRRSASCELSYAVTGARRGIHPLGPLQVTSTDPFGLARRTTVFGERTPVTVAPAIIDLPRAQQLRRRGRRHAAHHQQPARPGRRQPHRAAVRAGRLDAPHPLARDRAPRRAHGAAGGAGVHARGDGRDRPRRAAVLARGDAGAGRRSRVRGRRVGVRVGRRPDSCTTATPSR